MSPLLREVLPRIDDPNGSSFASHAEIVEPVIDSLVDIHGRESAVQILNTPGSETVRFMFELISVVRELVFDAEFNPNHPDDYSNAGGFFAHWYQYSEYERLEFMSKGLELTT